MKLTFTLLAASLATSVSAASYKLCCCTKTTPPQDLKDPRYYRDLDPAAQNAFLMGPPTEQCNHDATKAIVDSSDGSFKFSSHFWVGHFPTPRLRGQDYMYATGTKKGEDTNIGPKEIKGLCGRVQAGRYCFTPDSSFIVDYTGDHRRADNFGHD
ncbi:hypothetical protein EG328_003168 [Venturia inaequalis]|uniref:Uncharacterized protein n=1 Tax=Venturia inaequalis TaxID=5025 RepID=A0A8H3VQ31_VENIN|nr:hypothetical protein EG328_003168 [Venturia inaequalis]KAE9991723.1 hypothetical protein EG327_011084 [Venturia inaequalis]RDI84411.1 hypothetical protein Vi05172_g5768 [Venturia inaequalis]